MKSACQQQGELEKAYKHFWKWFSQHEKEFFDVIQSRQGTAYIEENFFDKLTPELEKIKENSYFFLTGMFDEQTAELILTAEGNLKNFVFVEELVASAPSLSGWKFTTLKPPYLDRACIHMNGYVHDLNTLFFSPDDDPEHPEEINLIIAHQDLTEDNESEVAHGVYIFLDIYLGEFEFATQIDNLTIIGKNNATQALRPIGELAGFLASRQKSPTTDIPEVSLSKDSFSALEWQTEDGKPILASINTDLLNMRHKAFYPWVGVLEIKYEDINDSGLPNQETLELIWQIEDKMIIEQGDDDSSFYIGRETGNGESELYFTSRDFRKLSKTLYRAEEEYSSLLEMDSRLYKDQYWSSFDRFRHEG